MTALATKKELRERDGNCRNCPTRPCSPRDDRRGPRLRIDEALRQRAAVDDLDFEVPVGSLAGNERRADGACGGSLERRPKLITQRS
jgi:hypothetical protein